MHKSTQSLLFCLFTLFCANAAGRQLTLPEACTTKASSFEILKQCAKQHFTVHGEPISPAIIETLLTWISDSGDQIIAIDLLSSQDSNRFFAQGYRVEKLGNFFQVQWTNKPPGATQNEIFAYSVEGLTDNGLFVIKTASNSGGSGTFMNLLIVRIDEELGIDTQGFTLSQDKMILKPTQKRLVIHKLAELPLGDRATVEIKVEANTVNLTVQPHLDQKPMKTQLVLDILK